MTGKKVGVAGFMGAGKTTCARFLADIGGMVINADAEAKRLMEGEPEIRRKLQQTFGDDIVDSAGIRFRALSELVFRSRENLERLNTIVHPPLLEYLQKVIQQTGRTVCVLDAALIPLWRIESWFDVRIWVDAPFETRLRRIREKTGERDEVVRRKMELQEQLFGKPSPDDWIIVLNDDGIDAFTEVIRNVVIGAQR